MSEQRRHSFFKRSRLALLIGAVMVALLGWAAWRESGTEAAIRQKLAEMRAAGEPIDAQDLARMFPDPPPEQDTLSVFARPFFIATNVEPNGPVPILTGAGVFDRKTPLDAAIHVAMTNYCRWTAGLTNLMPEPCPPETRLAEHRELGITNIFWGGGASRMLIQSLAVHTLNAIEAGDQQATSRLLEHDFCFARAVQARSSLIALMLHAACDNLACSVAERALNRLQFTEPQLARIASLMSPEPPGALTDAMRGTDCERIWELQQAQAGRHVSGFYSFGVGSTPEPFWRRPITRWKEGPKYHDEDFLLYLALIPRSRELFSLSGTQALTRFQALHIESTNRMVSRFGRVALSWDLTRLFKAHFSSLANMEATRTAFAIERFRLAHQQALPNSLPELVPVYLPAVPRDPFDERPLRFKKLPRGYFVYSIGPDGVDNGGTERTNQTVTTNYDVTFTVER